jgi:hypothetical protein
MVDAGDTVCAENQLLHGQYIDNVEQARRSLLRPAEHDRYNIATFVDDITVPVFLASAWQDEQTGPFFFTMLDKFDHSPAVRMNTYNGVHIDAYQPQVLEEWFTFLELFVASGAGRRRCRAAIAPQLYDQVFGVQDLVVDASRFSGEASYDAAVARWKAEPKLRALFESGAGGTAASASRCRPSSTRSRSGRRPAPPRCGCTRSPTARSARPRRRHQRGVRLHVRSRRRPPRASWRPAATSGTCCPATLAAAGRRLGGGVRERAADRRHRHVRHRVSVDLWVRSPVDDADLEVNLTEIRPDGQEVYVQSGWIRASLRGSGPSATDLGRRRVHRGARRAAGAGQWTQVRVGTAGIQHVFRAGSRVRVMVDTPGGSRAEWFFASCRGPRRGATTSATTPAHPSSVVLPWSAASPSRARCRRARRCAASSAAPTRPTPTRPRRRDARRAGCGPGRRAGRAAR